MQQVKKILIKLISFGVYPEMDDNKKIAIQIASFDGIASLLTFFVYTFNLFTHDRNFLDQIYIGATFLCACGLYLLSRRKYDSGRILIHFVGLLGIFLSIDGVGLNSGFEFYYFAPLIVPFVVFTPEEFKKSILLSLSGGIVFLIQQTIGTGHFSDPVSFTYADRILSISILFLYLIALFSISRWQVNYAQKKIKSQQSELIHVSNIAALGEMSGGIAHEINNPLQILSSQLAFVRKQLSYVENIPTKTNQTLQQMEDTILRISKLVKGLKNLSRNSASDPQALFPISDAIEDMLSVSSQKLKHLEIKLSINGDKNTMVMGHVVQLSQVFINLINNSVDAIDGGEDKWIVINIEKASDKIIISFIDSGKGISKEIVQKIMHPFFTTKEPGRGTGIGLSISNSMLAKVGGRLYYEENFPNTKFVIELPST